LVVVSRGQVGLRLLDVTNTAEPVEVAALCKNNGAAAGGPAPARVGEKVGIQSRHVVLKVVHKTMLGLTP